MTKANRDLRSCDNSNRNLRKLKQASLFSIFPQAQQDTNSEGSSFYPISPSLICKFRISDSNEPSQFLGLDGRSASEHCEHGSENVAIGEHCMKSHLMLFACQQSTNFHVHTDKHSIERMKTLLVSSLEIFGATSKSDTKPTFTNFELFDPQFEGCEKYHDNWLGLSIVDSSSAISHRECKRLDMSDIASSSDVSLSQGSFCLPPPNSVISSWSICNESKI